MPTKKGIDAVNALIEHKQNNTDPDEAKPHVGKQDVQEAAGKKRTGAPRPIQSKDGATVAETIRIAAPQLQHAFLLLIGETPLITNCWSWKTIQAMLRDHMQIAHTVPKSTTKPKDKKGRVREAKNPYDIFINSLYEHRDGGYGFPSNGVKKALVSATSFTDGVRPKFVSGAVRVNNELCQILGTPKARFDMVTVTDQRGNKSPDTRFRGQFDEWALKVSISYAKAIIDLPDIMNLFMWAGQSIGIGEWRAEKDGNNGAFRVASEEEVKDVTNRLKVANRKEMNEYNSGVQEILDRYKVFEFEEPAVA